MRNDPRGAKWSEWGASPGAPGAREPLRSRRNYVLPVAVCFAASLAPRAGAAPLRAHSVSPARPAHRLAAHVPARIAAPTGFTNQVLPVLTKAGCNSGACHGASAGKGGLKLTLRGYDPPADYATLTRQALARRVDLAEPAQSLLLRKPSGGTPHGGGKRFAADSPEYRILRDWIGQGCPPPSAADPRVAALEVSPSDVTLAPGQSRQVRVSARYSDGQRTDVTRWVKFGSGDDGVASVDDGGRVTLRGSGEAPITVWFASRVAFARFRSPYPNRPPALAFRRSARRGFVDDLVLKKLESLGIAPADPADDATFLRRLYLDTAGVLPTPDEASAFLRDCGAERGSAPLTADGAALAPYRARDAAVERLLQRPEFVDYWTYRWSDLFLVSTRKLPSRGMWTFYRWIRERVERNTPWDQVAREVLTATGSTFRNGAANYYVLHKDPIDLTETTTQAFLGMSLTCARCHNHPLEKWTQNDYYAMANLFGRLRLKNGEQTGETLVFAADTGDVNHPRANVPLPPRPLDGLPLPPGSTEDRRAHLARWLTAPDNPYFARALVNRVWRNFMGRGLVEAEDDLRQTNPPSNDELLTALAGDFVRSGYDVRRLIRTIVTSAAYQRSADPASGAPADGRYYSTYIPRRLPAEVLLDAISQVTGVPTAFPGYPPAPERSNSRTRRWPRTS